MQEVLSLANKLADAAGDVIRSHFRTPFDIIAKADETPVTIADRAVEARLREMIEATFPQDGILGEEFGEKPTQNGRVWVIDPIDGTKSFIIGRPTFGTLIALAENDIPVMGVIDQPIARERWIGAKGQATTFNGRSVRTRACPGLKEAVASCTSPRQIPALWPKFYAECKAMVWGGDCYSYGMLANGWLDVVVETGLATYDYAALSPIIEGAGGLMMDWNGAPLTLHSDGRTIALGDATLKNTTLAFVAE